MPAPRWLVTVLLGALVVPVVPAQGLADASTSMPTAAHVRGVPTVGPMFRHGLSQPHSCSGVVVHSASHNTVLTAAHCAIAAGVLFVPGYDRGSAPYGAWKVVRTYVDPHWTANQDPRWDFAVLVVASQTRSGRTVNVEDVAHAIRLGSAPPAGQRNIVWAYPYGYQDQPIRCAVTVYVHNTYPAIDCHGYTNGTSGGPWVLPSTSTSTARVVGVIGGYQRGGAYEYTSYTSRFGIDVSNLVKRAEAS